MTAAAERPVRLRGILSGVDRLEVSLHAVLVLLTVASALRYVEGHGLGDDAPAVLSGALVLLAPSFAWCAVPLPFVALRVLRFVAACAVVARAGPPWPAADRRPQLRSGAHHLAPGPVRDPG